jgi:hypothetical protein
MCSVISASCRSELTRDMLVDLFKYRRAVSSPGLAVSSAASGTEVAVVCW